MMLIEFANRNMQAAIGNGISSHNYGGYPVQNAGSANYVVLTNALAANFNKEYCTVTISKTSSGAHDLAWCRKITAITDMGDGNSKIEFDGAAVALAEEHTPRRARTCLVRQTASSLDPATSVLMENLLSVIVAFRMFTVMYFRDCLGC